MLNEAIFITRAGGPDVLEMREGATPEPGNGEVLVEVAFAGVNRHDLNQRRRGPTASVSDVPGLEISGRVHKVGPAETALVVGDSVCALVDGGGYARFALARVDLVLPVPAGLGLQESAALPEALFTIWHNFFDVARLQKDETVLIHGGTSGVGSVGLQVLRALGHEVFVTCGTDTKCELARSLGASKAFNYRRVDFAKAISECSNGRGVDVILDMVGARYAKQNIEALARRGRLVHISQGDGTDFSSSLRTIMSKELKVTGSLLRPLPADEKASIARDLRGSVLPLIEAGMVRPLVNATYPLALAAEAHRALESGDVAGKLLLDCTA